MDQPLVSADTGQRTLAYVGILDIFEATTIHQDAVALVSDPNVSAIHLDLSQAERIDATIYQVLRALRNSATARGLSVTSDASPAIVSQLADLGLSI